MAPLPSVHAPLLWQNPLLRQGSVAFLNLHKTGFVMKIPSRREEFIYLFLTILPSFFHSLPDSTTSLSETLETDAPSEGWRILPGCSLFLTASTFCGHRPQVPHGDRSRPAAHERGGGMSPI